MFVGPSVGIIVSRGAVGIVCRVLCYDVRFLEGFEVQVWFRGMGKLTVREGGSHLNVRWNDLQFGGQVSTNTIRGGAGRKRRLLQEQ